MGIAVEMTKAKTNWIVTGLCTASELLGLSVGVCDWRNVLIIEYRGNILYFYLVFFLVFTVRLHVMQRTVLLSEFCPSVCLSVRQMRVL